MLPDHEMAGASLGALLEAQAYCAAIINNAKAQLAFVQTELAARYGDSAKQALLQKGKEHGSISLPLQDGFTAKAELKQAVSWDSDKLMAIAQTLPWDKAQALFKIKFSMAETTYKGVAVTDPELCARIDDARTTKIGEPVITLTKEA